MVLFTLVRMDILERLNKLQKAKEKQFHDHNKSKQKICVFDLVKLSKN